MSCKTINAIMLPIKRHEIKIFEHEGYEVTPTISPRYLITSQKEKGYSFLYCVSYRHPSLPEWILARGFWNDEGIWTNEDIWNDF